MQVQKTTKRNAVKSKKQQNEKVRPQGNEGEESNINGGSDGQSSTSTYSSEDDNASQETNNEDSKSSSAALNLSGKQRASRGSATDPQSLYARVTAATPLLAGLDATLPIVFISCLNIIKY